ncbi:EpsG family protein [Stutzerimonas balearica]|uniref:EpsG family protein n=1 Tax=Stutzerimonas balearica TaxID=74829 RepID=UPI0028A2BA5C|nr:EpsG family protein [Stutzerimonas balearica]
MFFYNLIYFLVWILAFFGFFVYYERPLYRLIFVIQAGVLCGFSAFRFETGYDWRVYREHFDAVASSVPYHLSFEPLYSLSVNLFVALGANFSTFSAFFSFFVLLLMALGLWKLYKRVAVFVLPALYSIPDFYLIPSFSLMRQSMAVAFFILGVALYFEGRNKTALLIFVLSCGFHFSAALAVVIFFISLNWRATSRSFLAVFAVGAFLYFGGLDVPRHVISYLAPVLGKYALYGDKDVYNASFIYRLVFLGVSSLCFVLLMWVARARQVTSNDCRRLFVLAFLALVIPLYIFAMPTVSTRYQYFFCFFLLGELALGLVLINQRSRVLIWFFLMLLLYVPFYRFLNAPLSIVYIPYQDIFTYNNESSSGSYRTDKLLEMLDSLWAEHLK